MARNGTDHPFEKIRYLVIPARSGQSSSLTYLAFRQKGALYSEMQWHMGENAVLLRQKEQEALKKITEKVGKLTVFGGVEGVLQYIVKINVRLDYSDAYHSGQPQLFRAR